MDEKHVAYLGACPNNVWVVVASEGSVGAMMMHVAFVGGGRLGQMGVNQIEERSGIVFSSVSLARASRSVAAVGEQSS